MKAKVVTLLCGMIILASNSGCGIIMGGIAISKVMSHQENVAKECSKGVDFIIINDVNYGSRNLLCK